MVLFGPFGYSIKHNNLHDDYIYHFLMKNLFLHVKPEAPDIREAI